MKAEVGRRESVVGRFPPVGASSPLAARPLARIAKNFVSLTLASGLVAGGVFVLNVVVARSFGPAEFGQYRFALTFVALFHTLYHLGVGILIIRDVARDKSQAARALGASLTIALTLGLLSVGLIALVVTLIGYSPSTRLLILVLAVAQLPYTLTLLCQAVFRAFERMEIETLLSFLGTAIMLVLAFAALSLGGGLVLVASAQVPASVLTFFLAFALVRIFFTRPRLTRDLQYFRYLLVSSIPFAVNGLLVPLYLRIDVILVQALEGEAAVGLYSAAFTIVAPLGLLAHNAVNAVFPPLASAYASSQRSYQALLATICRWSLALLVLPGVAMTLLAEPMLGLVFGSTYRGATTPLQILVWGSILTWFNSVFLIGLQASDRQVRATLILATGAALNFLLSLLLIKAFGLVGAAAAFLATQAIILLLIAVVGGEFRRSSPRPVEGQAMDGRATSGIPITPGEG